MTGDVLSVSPDAAATILCVDDEPNILTALRRLFRPQGYKVLTAESGSEGLQLLANEAVNLIISDMRMPHMNGAEFLERVMEHWPHTVRILLTGYADLQSTVAAVNRGNIYRYVSKPWEDSDLKLAVRHGLERQFLERDRQRLLDLTKQQNEELKKLNADLEQKVSERTEELRETMAALEKAHAGLKSSYVAAVRIFANLLEVREKSMAGHSRRVAEQARTLAQRMALQPADIEAVLFAGLLHDIGKIGLPDKLINKPFQALTAIERDKVAKHPVVGQAALMSMEYLQGAAHLIRSHHVRFDGQGYPDRLKGEAVPMGARILSVVNDFDALQRGSLATIRYSAAQACDYLIENKGKRYDPQVVDAFLDLLGQSGSDLEQEPEVVLASDALQEGMVLVRDLTTRDGVLLLSVGYILERKLIDKIQQFEKAVGYGLTIYVSPNHPLRPKNYG